MELPSRWRQYTTDHLDGSGPLNRYVKLRVAHALGMPGTFSPPPRLSKADMYHGTCVTHVPWCMPGSLTSGGGENVPGILGACATRNFTYLVRGPYKLVQRWPNLHCCLGVLLYALWCVDRIHVSIYWFLVTKYHFHPCCQQSYHLLTNGIVFNAMVYVCQLPHPWH